MGSTADKASEEEAAMLSTYNALDIVTAPGPGGMLYFFDPAAVPASKVLVGPWSLNERANMLLDLPNGGCDGVGKGGEGEDSSSRPHPAMIRGPVLFVPYHRASHLTKLLRPEFVANLVDSHGGSPKHSSKREESGGDIGAQHSAQHSGRYPGLSSDAFSFFGANDPAFPGHCRDLVSATRRLMTDVLDEAVSALATDNRLLQVSSTHVIFSPR